MSSMKTLVLVGLVGVVVLSAGTAIAQEDPLAFTFDTTYSSKYMWRGYDIFGENSAFMPSLDVDLFGTGWSFNVWSAWPLGSGSEDLAEIDYTFAYGTTLGEGEACQTDLGANWIYYDFPNVGNKFTPDTVEFGIGAEWPNVFGDSGLTPSVYFGMLDAAEDNVGFEVDGNYFSFALSYDFEAGGLGWNLSSDVNYNDGLFGSDNDWSHSTFTLSTSMDCGPVAVAPFVSYQWSFDDSVNSDGSEIWGGVSASMSF